MLCLLVRGSIIIAIVTALLSTCANASGNGQCCASAGYIGSCHRASKLDTNCNVLGGGDDTWKYVSKGHDGCLAGEWKKYCYWNCGCYVNCNAGMFFFPSPSSLFYTILHHTMTLSVLMHTAYCTIMHCTAPYSLTLVNSA